MKASAASSSPAGGGGAEPLPRRRGRPRLDDAEGAALDAAAALLAEAPVQALTMEQVAQRAGISKITLYRRWPSRPALLVDVLMHRMAAALPLDESLPPPEAISRHLRRMAQELGGATGRLARGVIGECLADPAAAAELRAHYLGGRRDTAIAIIARGLAEGSFAMRADAETLHDMLYGAIWYRFLFGVGRLDARAALSLMRSVLLPAEDSQGSARSAAASAPADRE